MDCHLFQASGKGLDEHMEEGKSFERCCELAGYQYASEKAKAEGEAEFLKAILKVMK